MKRITPLCIKLILCASALGASPDNVVIPYKFPAEFPVSERYQVTVDDTAITPLQTKRGAILNFGMSGTVKVQVELNEPPSEVIIRPLNAGIKASINGKQFSFELPEAMNLSVEVDGDLDDPLLVFANPELPAPPDRNDPKVKYFEAGKIHDAGEIFLETGETLYLEPGAIVNADVRAIGAQDIAIRGGGILHAGHRDHKINMVVLRECRSAVIEDVIVLDSLGWTVHLSGSEKIRLFNTRIIGWRANCDGLDIEYSRDVDVEKCFIRTYDDCIAIKALHPPGEKEIPFEEMINPETMGKQQAAPVPGDVVGDITIKNTILWADAAQGFEIGFELRVDRIRGIIFRDCDIIHARGGAAFSIHNGDRAQILDILLEDIRVEEVNRLFDFHVGLSIYSDDCPMPYRRTNANRKAPTHRPEQANNPWQWYVPQEEKETARYEPNRGYVRNVRVRNMKVLTQPKKSSILQGYSENKAISNVTFEGLTIAGNEITSVDQIDLYQKHVRKLQFVPKREASTHWDPVIQEVEGWTVHIDPQLLPGGAHADVGKRAIPMLRNHLQRIAILLPAEQLQKMRSCEIWLEHEHPELSNMQYHPDATWLTDRGYDARLAKKVHITHAAALYSRSQMLKHPAVILHELAHAYHDQILGFDHPDIIAAYEQAMAAGTYEKVLLYTGDRVKHYAATNHKEYFAESTEAFLYRNDFYPFTAAELKEHDPKAYKLMQVIWESTDSSRDQVNSSSKGFIWESEVPDDSPLEPSEQLTGVYFTGRHSDYRVGDTFYPSWASDGNLYSPWTDGKTDGISCSSGGGLKKGLHTGHAIMKGDDPLRLIIKNTSPPNRPWRPHIGDAIPAVRWCTMASGITAPIVLDRAPVMYTTVSSGTGRSSVPCPASTSHAT